MKVTSSVFQQSKLQIYKTNETGDSGHTMRLVTHVSLMSLPALFLLFMNI